MASPVLHKMICGSFREGTTRQLSLEDMDAKAFEKIFALWCGKEGRAEQLGDVMVMASVADRLEMLDVLAVLEAAIIGPQRLCFFALRCRVAPCERIDRQVDQGVGDGAGAGLAVREDPDEAQKLGNIACGMGGEAH